MPEGRFSLRGSSITRFGDATLNLRDRTHRPGTPTGALATRPAVGGPAAFSLRGFTSGRPGQAPAGDPIPHPMRRHSPAPATLKAKRQKVATVMHEYGAGHLKSGSGHPVKGPDQAMAIAMSEAWMSRKKKGRR